MDAKLIQAHAEILAILKRLDIAGYVFLHNAPGSTEVFFDLSPSYSRITVVPAPDGNIGLRIRSKLKEDYGGDKEAQRRDLAATTNMVSTFAMLLGTAALPMLTMAEHLDSITGAKHGPLEPSEGTEH